MAPCSCHEANEHHVPVAIGPRGIGWPGLGWPSARAVPAALCAAQPHRLRPHPGGRALIAPQLAGAHKALHLLGSVQPAYIGVGILLEAGALLAYAQLTRTVLPKDGPSLSTLLRIDLSTMAVSHVLPGGTAAGAGLGYRLLTEKGVSGSDTGFALATQGIGSAVVLNLVLWLALLISIPLRGFIPFMVRLPWSACCSSPALGPLSSCSPRARRGLTGCCDR